MPNHVTTVIESSPEALDALFNADGGLDFNTLIPAPANIETGGCTGQHEPGVVCWRTWNIENWGTKWNGYDAVRISTTELQFDTAWSHPFPVMQALTEKFPDEELRVWFADEDLGHNVGTYWAKAGSLIEAENLDGTQAGFELACRLKFGQSAEEFRADNR